MKTRTTYQVLDHLVDAVYQEVDLNDRAARPLLRKALAAALWKLRDLDTRNKQVPMADANVPFRRFVVHSAARPGGATALLLSCGHVMPWKPSSRHPHQPLSVKCFACKYPNKAQRTTEVQHG